MCKADGCEETNGSRFGQTRSSDYGIPRWIAGIGEKIRV